MALVGFKNDIPIILEFPNSIEPLDPKMVVKLIWHSIQETAKLWLSGFGVVHIGGCKCKHNSSNAHQ